MEFFKYQSLGNDFVLIDAIDKPDLSSILTNEKVKSICDRHLGIGADGILIIQRPVKNKNVQCEILNADGSKAELCINGIRCIAHYLLTYHNFPTEFILDMGNRSIKCSITNKKEPTPLIILDTGKAESYKQTSISLSNKRSIAGDVITFSNPHFIIFENTTIEKFKKESESISIHPNFPNQTNVACVYQEDLNNNIYSILFYERGVGETLGCGSGASAVMWALYQQQKINLESNVTLQMPGGIMHSYINKDHHVIQKAGAHLVFQGNY